MTIRSRRGRQHLRWQFGNGAELLAGFANLADPEEQRQRALLANRRHVEVVPFIPLTRQDRLCVVSRRVHNYTPHSAPWLYEVHPDLWVGTA